MYKPRCSDRENCQQNDNRWSSGSTLHLEEELLDNLKFVASSSLIYSSELTFSEMPSRSAGLLQLSTESFTREMAQQVSDSVVKVPVLIRGDDVSGKW